MAFILFRIINYSTIAIFLLLSLSASWTVTVAQVTQVETASLNAKRDAAAQALKEGLKLYKQGTPESLRQAIKKYEEALQLWRQLGNTQEAKRWESVTLNAIAKVYSDLGLKQQALDNYNQALPLLREMQDKGSIASTLNKIAGLYSDLGLKPQALDSYNQALALFRELKNSKEEAITLNNIGGVYDSLGDKLKALELYNQALPLSRSVDDKASVATALTNTGFVYDSLGEKQKALELYNQALVIWRQLGDGVGEAGTINNISSVYDDVGEKQKALDNYNQALLLWRKTGDKTSEAKTLNNIGLVYHSLGERQQALEFFQQALSIRRAVGDKAGIATTLNNIGSVYSLLEQKQQALSFFNQALTLRQEVGDKLGTARTLNNIGKLYYSLGNKQQALNFLNRALPLLKEVGDKGGEANTLNNIGLVLALGVDKEQALGYYNQALPLRRLVGDKGGEATTLASIAFVEKERGNFDNALSNIEAAIKIIEELRTKIDSLELRASFFASKQDVYEFYIDLLMELHKKQPSKGYDGLALYASERSRARNLLELLSEANADIRAGVEQRLLFEERSLEHKLDAAEKRRVQLLSNNRGEKQLQSLERDIAQFLEKYQQVKAKIRSTSPRYAALTQPKPLNLSEIQQQVLDDDTLLLQYSLGKERSYLWAITKTSINSYQLPKREEIESAASELIKNVTIPNQRGRQKKFATSAGKLSQMILEPVSGQLGKKRLLFVTDGVLQYTPLSALPLPNTTKSLLSVHEVVNLPSATTLGVLRQQLKGRKIAPKTLAVIADPVFSKNDQRISKSGLDAVPQNPDNLASGTNYESNIQLDRLPFTRKEGSRILSLVPQSLSTSAFDFLANRKFVTNSQLQEYRIIHFATHGILNSLNPELSGIVLSLFDSKGKPQNGFLRLHDIFNLNLPVELVVLSACETGLGKVIKGEGLVGLTRGFMYAGTPRVVVSLWSVDDEATSELMERFYQGILKKGLKPAAALRTAQLEMSQQPQWKSPYYWAGFTLQGEWQ
jgi:CHAT domain-containing protein/Tfp pilus assembly protein PilF